MKVEVNSDVGAVSKAIEAITQLIREIADPKKQMQRLNVKRRKWDQEAMDAAENYILITEDINKCDDEEIVEKLKKKQSKFKETFFKYN